MMNIITVKTILMAFIILFSGSASYSQKDWGSLGNYPGTPREQAVSFTIGGKGYFGMGRDSTGYKKDFWEYDISTNTWTQLSNFAGDERFSAVGFEINGKGYIGIGGNASQDLNDFWEYEPVTDTWTQKANFGGVARKYAVGFSINDKGYIGLGHLGNDFWEYDPLIDKWTRKADFLGVIRWGAVGFSIGSKGYVGTGMYVAEGNKKDFWEYDPKSNIWTQLADLGGIQRAWAVGFSIGDKGYIGVGYDISSSNYGRLSDFWEYDTLLNQWTEIAEYRGGVVDNPTYFSNDTIAIVGTGMGAKNESKKDFYIYPSAYSFIERNSFESNLAVFPNPANEIISFIIDQKKELDLDYVIYDYLGSIALKGSINTEQSINIELLRPGVYIFKAQYLKKIFSSKFIKR